MAAVALELVVAVQGLIVDPVMAQSAASHLVAALAAMLIPMVDARAQTAIRDAGTSIVGHASDQIVSMASVEEVTASLVLTMYAFQVHVPASTVPPGGGEGEQEEGEEDEDDEADSCPLIRLPPTVSTSSGDQAYEINPPAGSSGWKSPPEVNNGGGGSTTTGGPPEPTLDPDPFAQRFEIWARTQMKGPAFIEQWNSGTEGRNKFQRCQNALERVTMELDVTGWPSVVSPIEHLRLWSGLQECTWTPKSGLNWEAENASAWIGDIMI
ncbi:hypothetical protein TWF106_006770 [Orbilia oligospora]|uniref:Uncharacterized protein n=1 Tax=Orbilia oligospora TaxID=2813651 RepID=A0A6G1MGS3_ORBOL|nr:hypothetical protein TWF679_002413 [Orbilia oligospora]KAF3220444.1 hypothetical protein TWF106_006770 [Orbilia oligospora]KAF3230219.1 hypothetical protein TWF191_010917 [Orbilia oligospora]KAF3256480.1 hypothetical protein TWF192_001904 [Orbilia oligospora]